MKRLALSLSLAIAWTALGSPGAARDRAKIEIEHLDGTGTKTIIEVQPSLPGAAELIRQTPGPIPEPGQVILPPSPTPTWSPRATPKPPSW